MKTVLLVCLAWLQACLAAGQPRAHSIPAPSPLAQALDAYGKLTQRTILYPTALPSLDGFLGTQLPEDTNAAIRFIESRLKEKQIELVIDGLKFVRALPVGWSNSPAAAFLLTVKAPDQGSQQLPWSVVDWLSVDPLQALDFYGKLRPRTFLHSWTLPRPGLALKNQTALTRSELCYALTVVLALNGIAAVDDGDKFVQVVPVAEWSRVEGCAPHAEAGEAVLNPSTLPKVMPEFPTGSPSSQALGRLIEFYATLAGKKAAPVELRGSWPVAFEVTTPLTKTEVLYAIETSLQLGGLGLQKVDGDTVRVVPLAELRSLKAPPPASSQQHRTR